MSVLMTILTAFGSGVLGGCLGAMPAVIMCGVGVCIGMVGAVSGSDFNWLGDMAFGMFIGPQVSCAPACAAAAYAKMKGYIDSSKDIFKPLISIGKPDVLIVSGLFAVLGWYTNLAIASALPGRIDSVACTIVVISMIGRILFAKNGIKGVIGDVPEGKRRFAAANSDAWIPYQTGSNSLQLVLLGTGVGVASGYITTLLCNRAVETGNDMLMAVAAMPVWGIAIVWCIAMTAGCNVPVAHHIGLVAGYAAKMAFIGGMSNDLCVFWGIAFGLAGAYTADILGKLLTVYGEGYVDPPSMAITFWSVFLLWLFPSAGFMEAGSAMSVAIPSAVMLICIALAAVQAYSVRRSTAAMGFIQEEENAE